MATKTSSIYIRLEPDVKEQAEKVLTALGLPLSNAVNIFLKQVAMKRCIPFSLSLPEKRQIEMDRLSEQELEQALHEGYQAYLDGKGKPAQDVFSEIEKGYPL